MQSIAGHCFKIQQLQYELTRDASSPYPGNAHKKVNLLTEFCARRASAMVHGMLSKTVFLDADAFTAK